MSLMGLFPDTPLFIFCNRLCPRNDRAGHWMNSAYKIMNLIGCLTCMVPRAVSASLFHAYPNLA